MQLPNPKWTLAPTIAATLATILSLSACAGDDQSPTVLSTTPANGALKVDPATTQISVTFSEPMRDSNWSWVYESKDSFPQLDGDPRFENGYTTNVITVTLELGKDYVIWINSQQFYNFKDQAGNAAIPYKLTFRTAG